MQVDAVKAAGIVGIAALVAGGVAGVYTPRSSAITREVMLTSGLGDGEALILGAGGIGTPSEAYMSTIDQVYLEPLGFTGTTVAVSHAYVLSFDSRVDSEATAIVNAVNAQMATGDVSADNPLVIVGYSESAAAATSAMEQLQAEGDVPTDDLHFVLLGDPESDFGGFLNSFVPSLPASLQGPVDQFLTSSGSGLADLIGGTTPDDLYPTTVYTLAGDPFGNWPQDAGTNLFASMEALAASYTTHLEYPGLTATEVGDAVLSHQDGLADYYTIPDADINPLSTLWEALVNLLGTPG